MFRQDYRINKIFLHLQKKCKKHHPSSKEGVQSLRQQNIKANEKVSIVDSSVLFPRSGIEFSRLHLEAVKKIKSILLILSENILDLCLDNCEVISKLDMFNEELE